MNNYDVQKALYQYFKVHGPWVMGSGRFNLILKTIQGKNSIHLPSQYFAS